MIADDDATQRKMLMVLLRRKFEFDSLEAENGREAIDILKKNESRDVKLIILDLEMPVMGGLETLEIVQQKYPFIPVIMLTGNKDSDMAVKAMKIGALDFLTKPYNGERMAVTVRNALKISTLSKEVSRLKSEREGVFRFENLIGYEKGLQPVIQQAYKMASSHIPVLISGETGTGKEVFAKAIHGESARAGKSFIAVNCGAIPSQLVESTLFGHEKGAFTGATEKTVGKFREAEEGTIFLDEVGELPLDAQVKLLRVLQQKEVEPVGASRSVPVNVRVVSATNRDLKKEVEEGRFREDLFFRLNVLQVELPPLRDRKEDIPRLVHHFMERFCNREGAILKTVPETVMASLIAYDWPGNVRQLENAVNRAMVMGEENILSFDNFQIDNLSTKNNLVKDAYSHDYLFQPQNSEEQEISIFLRDNNGNFKTAEDIEKEAIEKVLNAHDGNVTQAAKALNIAKSTFYKKIQK